MAALGAIASEYGLFVVDDAAHALPATVGDRLVGAMGYPSAFSFYATKTLTTGEGGMLTTDDDALAARARMMALHGITRDAWKRYTAGGSWFYEVADAGFKYNLTDIAAALGRVQLRRLHEMRDGRARIAARYDAAFAGLDAVDRRSCSRAIGHAWHLYAIRLRLGSPADRPRPVDRGAQGAPDRDQRPLHPAAPPALLRDEVRLHPGQFPVAEAEYPRLVSLPIYSPHDGRRRRVRHRRRGRRGGAVPRLTRGASCW